MIFVIKNELKSFLKSKSKLFLLSCLSFVAGVAVFLWLFPLNDKRISLVLLISSLLFFLIAILCRKDIWVRITALIFGFLALGFGISIYYQVYFLSPKIDPPLEKEIEFSGFICNDPETRTDRQVFEFCLLEIDGKEAFQEKILVTFDLYPQIKYSEVLKIKGKIKEPGEFEDFDYKKYLLVKKIFWVSYYPEIEINDKYISKNEIGAKHYNLKFKKSLFVIKDRFELAINQILSEPYSSLLSGIILGERESFSPEFKEALNKTGTTHIIALSGFNVTIIIFAVASLLKGLSRRRIFYISLALVIIFAVMTGASPSIVRASIMTMLIFAAPLLGRKAKAINILIPTAAVMILLNPLIMRYDLGFVLSFGSLLGLLYLAPIISQKINELKSIKKAPQNIKNAFSETISAQLFVLPIILYNFSRISIIAPITNLLILPIIPLTMLLGFVAATAAIIWQPLGIILSFPAYAFLYYIVWVVQTFSKIPLSSIEIQSGNPIIIILLYLIIASLVYYLNKRYLNSNDK